MVKCSRKGGDRVADIMIFKRYEKKYRLNKNEYSKLMSLIHEKLVPDKYGISTLCSLYLDTPDFVLIRNSIEAESYKEKLRIRSYGVPSDDKKLFFEIKKKYKGVVYKRRVSMTERMALEYIESGEKPFDSQIMREIDYAMTVYRRPKPNVCILCEREAFFTCDSPDVRLTFDKNLRYRRGFPREENVSDGVPLIGEDEYILEIKTPGAMPLWLAHALSECAVYPTKFSKYANAYYDIIKKEKE